MGPYGNIRDQMGPYKTIRGHMGPYNTIPKNQMLNLSWFSPGGPTKSNDFCWFLSKFPIFSKISQETSLKGVRTLIRPDFSSNQQKVKLMSARTKSFNFFSNFFSKDLVEASDHRKNELIIGNLIANQYHKPFEQFKKLLLEFFHLNWLHMGDFT